jgi:DNA-binding NarL/FixJ family response regulator
MSERKPQCLILIATSVPEVSRRWKNALRDSFTIESCMELAETERTMEELKPSVVLIDLALMPEYDTERLTSLLNISPASRVMLFSQQPDEQQGVDALKAGVRGYAHRDLDAVLLRKAIESLRKGELWISRNAISLLLKQVAGMNQDPRGNATDTFTYRFDRRRSFPLGRKVDLERLTSREQEIAYLIGNGSSNKEIASLLKISESTVKAHLSAIYHKLGLLDRLSLALFVAEQIRTGQSETSPREQKF